MSRDSSSPIALGLLLSVIGSILFSAKAIVVKLAYQGSADPYTFLALRMVFAFPFFLLALFWHSRKTPLVRLSKKELLHVLFMGFIGYYLSSLFDFVGLQYLSAGLERIILYLSPTLVLLISGVVLKKKIIWQQWLALGIAYAGVIIVFIDHVSWTNTSSIGAVFVFCSALTYAVYLIMAGELVKRIGSIPLVCYASTGSMVCSVIQALIISPGNLIHQDASIYVLSLFNASFCTFIPMVLIMVSVSRIGSALSAQAGMAGPVATIFLGWWFLGEVPGAFQVIGTVVVLAGVALLLSARQKKSQ